MLFSGSSGAVESEMVSGDDDYAHIPLGSHLVPLVQAVFHSVPAMIQITGGHGRKTFTDTLVQKHTKSYTLWPKKPGHLC